jgi:hypothetical protein
MDQDTTITITLPVRAAQSLLMIAQFWCDDENLDPVAAADTYINQDDVWGGIHQLEVAVRERPALPTYEQYLKAINWPGLAMKGQS